MLLLLIVIFAVFVVAVSLFMIAKPDLWAEKAEQYIRLRYLHPLEILLRLVFGIPFILYAESSSFPLVFKIFGYLLVAVGLGLALVPPSLHRRYGLWSLGKVGKLARPLAVGSLAFGLFLLYALF